MQDSLQHLFGATGRIILEILQAGGFVVLVVSLASAASWISRRQIEPLMARRSFGRNGALLIGRLISVMSFVVALLVILAGFGASWTGLLTVLSAFTVAIGLALQDVLKNFFSGLYLLVERPFAVGDRIGVGTTEGEVQGIDIRTTLIRDNRGALVLIPNSTVFTSVLTNRSHYQTRRLDVTLSSPDKSVYDIEKALSTGVGDLGAVRKPISAPSVVKSSDAGVTLTYSLLIDARPESERTVIDAIIQSMPGVSIEVQQ